MSTTHYAPNAQRTDDDLGFCLFGFKGKDVRQGVVRLATGIYSRPLILWWSLFPRGQLMVIRAEQLKAEPETILPRVFQHLRLDPVTQERLQRILSTVLHPVTVTTKKAKGANSRSDSRKLRMPQEARDLLQNFYAPFNRELSILLNDSAFLWHDT